MAEDLKQTIIQKMQLIGYTFIWRADDNVPYMMFVKGYTTAGITGQAFHVHMADHGHSLWNRIYFRDYLKVNPLIAREYENLKLLAAEKHRYNREEYTRAKADFVKRITAIAMEGSKHAGS